MIQPGTLVRSDSPPQLGALTGMRGIAAWFVVLYHMRPSLTALFPEAVTHIMDKGYLAVDLFFMLSGFVIWLNYAPRIQAAGFGYIPTFLWRRIARIWPLHLFILGGGVMLALTLAATGREDVSNYPFAELPLHILLIQNWGFTDELMWNHPAWSISTEFAAYLLFPFLALSINWNKHGVSLLVILIISLAIIQQFSFEMYGYNQLGKAMPQTGLVRCLIQFAMGTILCALWQSLREFPKAAIYCLGATIFSVILYVWALPLEPMVIPLIFAPALLTIALANNGWTGWLSQGPLLYLGEISYSTYLVHFLFFRVFKLIFVDENLQIGIWGFFGFLALTLIASILLYHIIEKPAQKTMNGWRIPFVLKSKRA